MSDIRQDIQKGETKEHGCQEAIGYILLVLIAIGMFLVGRYLFPCNSDDISQNDPFITHAPDVVFTPWDEPAVTFKYTITDDDVKKYECDNYFGTTTQSITIYLDGKCYGIKLPELPSTLPSNVFNDGSSVVY